MAAPIASQVLGEILPYLEVSKNNINDENEVKKIRIPNVEGISICEARKILKDLKLNLELSSESGEPNEESIINQQIPISGVEVMEETSVIVNCNTNAEKK